MSGVLQGIGLWIVVLLVLGLGVRLLRNGTARFHSGQVLEDGAGATAARLSVAVVLIVIALAAGAGWLIRHL